jgi:hypothetical protein
VQLVQRVAKCWTVQGSNPGGGEIFPTHPDQSRGLPNLLYNGYRVSFLGVKWLRRGINHSTPSGAEVREYRYTSTPPLGLHGLFSGEL